MTEVTRLADQTIDEAIESAYWQFDAMRKGLNEWAHSPKSERDAFKLVCWGLATGIFPVPSELVNSASQRDALAALVQAVERENAAIKATVGDTEFSLRQQLADAQGRVLEVGELNVKLRDAEQEAGRLKAAIDTLTCAVCKLDMQRALKGEGGA